MSKDEGVRATTQEGLAKLKPVFKADGSTTAGNASQVFLKRLGASLPSFLPSPNFLLGVVPGPSPPFPAFRSSLIPKVSDGAALTMVMSEATAKKYGLKPMGVFRSFSVVGMRILSRFRSPCSLYRP